MFRLAEDCLLETPLRCPRGSALEGHHLLDSGGDLVPLDADVAAQLEALEALGAPALSDGTVAEARANYDSAPKPDADQIVRIEDHTVPGPAGEIAVRKVVGAAPSSLIKQFLGESLVTSVLAAVGAALVVVLMLPLLPLLPLLHFATQYGEARLSLRLPLCAQVVQ